MFSSPAGGASELFSSPSKGFVEPSGGGGLSQSQVQALIDTSLTGAVQPSSVTVSGGGQVKATGGFNFDTSAVPDGQESSIEREGNGGMILKRGGTTFLTLSPFTGATFGVNLTASQGLTVQGSFTANGGISGVYTSSQTDALLNQKQAILSDNAGTGVTLRDNTAMRRVFGTGGVNVTVPLNIADATDPQNYNLKIDGSALQTSIGSKQDALTSSSSVAVGTLTAATEIIASTVKAPSGGSVLLGNSASTGVFVASNGAVGILKTSPTEPLDVYGNAAISGTVTAGGNITSSGQVSSTGGGYDPYGNGGRAVISCITSSSSAIETVGADFYFGSGGNAGGAYGNAEWSLFASPSGSFQLWALPSYTVFTVDHSTRVVVFTSGHQNASDASLKTPNPPAASSEAALQMLKKVEAKVYTRLDQPENGTRIGFVAQEVEAACPSEWVKGLIGSADMGGRDGAPQVVKTVDYARLVCCLWQANRAMLSRIEALEAAAAP